MEGKGYFKTEHGLQDLPFSHDHKTFRLYFHFRDEVRWNAEPTYFRGVKIERGQVGCTQRELAEACGMSRKEIRTSLGKLVRLNTIRANKRANRITVITLCDYETCEGTEVPEGPKKGPTKGQPRANQGPTKGQPIEEESKKVRMEEEKDSSEPGSEPFRLNGEAETETPRKRKVPPELRELIEWWNNLVQANLVKTGVRINAPNRGVWKAWDVYAKSPELQAMFANLDVITGAIVRADPDLMHRSWFCLAGLIGGCSSKHGNVYIEQLLDGHYGRSDDPLQLYGKPTGKRTESGEMIYYGDEKTDPEYVKHRTAWDRKRTARKVSA